MRKKIDFNSDMGEAFGAYTMGLDEEILEHITSANIACGFHAGDPMVMRQTVQLAEERGVAIGAHPGLPDLMGFGRRDMAVSPEEAKSYITYQVGALTAFTKAKKLQHVKPHGALYNMAVRNKELAKAIAEAVKEFDKSLILVVLAGTEWVQIVQEVGVKVAREVFADRALNPDGSLVPRSKPGSVIHDLNEVVARSLKMITQGKVTAINGQEIAIQADTISLHSDTPGAVQLAKTLKEHLKAEGIEIAPIGTFL
ncbi:MAG: LamB/YcsF family protein [Chloroflexi bacterium]|nr:LamB/YcsF family protein [Chloroflexota bacterium]